MWKKDEQDDEKEGTSGKQKPAGEEPRGKQRRPGSGSPEPATIGPSITIKGDVTGDEDLLIQGKVDGLVNLKQQSVTVGPEGRVKADITGRVVTVHGEVEGDLKADEQVILRSEARVEGDITAPRVVLEDGASFKGLVDMSGRSERTDGSPKKSSPRSTASTKSGEPSGSSGGSSGASGSKSDGSSDSSAAKAGASAKTEKASP